MNLIFSADFACKVVLEAGKKYYLQQGFLRLLIGVPWSLRYFPLALCGKSPLAMSDVGFQGTVKVDTI